jgi:MFS family permease
MCLLHTGYIGSRISRINGRTAAGFGLGPFIAGPSSDIFGRRMVYVASYASFAAFSWGVAYAPNYAALVVFRLLGK